MTNLSVNINKIATLRNSRGNNNPDVLKTALDIERFGADGITVHPRPDQRHITYEDVRILKKNIQTELNIEGNPKESKFVDLVLEVKPTQVTLVPDASEQLTSNQGWDTILHQNYLQSICQVFKSAGIRVSIFLNPDPKWLKNLDIIQPDQIELYTYNYAHEYRNDKFLAINPYIETAVEADRLGFGVHAGHDLSLENLQFFAEEIPFLAEVSIGHALICDAIYLGLENTIQLYKKCLPK